jgi:putative endonuclease
MEGITENQPCVYLLANKRNGALYTGVTNNLRKRIRKYKHSFNRNNGDAYALVWFEAHETIDTAILRKKTINNWQRVWKVRKIEDNNPHWRDLYQDLL